MYGCENCALYTAENSRTEEGKIKRIRSVMPDGGERGRTSTKSHSDRHMYSRSEQIFDRDVIMVNKAATKMTHVDH